MAKMPAAAAPMPADDDEDDTGGDTGGADMGGDAGGDDDAPGDEDVILTVCKEADGTYCLYKGDEEDADGADAAGSADAEGGEAGSNKQTFEDKGKLLKAILDILNEDEESGGGAGGGEDQFAAGFNEGAPGAAAAAPAQKY